MAVAAILDNRLVFEAHRTAFLGVAQEARFVDRVLDQEPGARRAVRVVAIRADDLANLDRVGRCLEAVGTLLFVAREANGSHLELVKHVVLGLVHLVAIVTRDVVVRVHAAGPVHALGAAVAGQALICTDRLIGLRVRTLLEDDIWRIVFLGQVVLAFAVAGSASRCTRIAANAVLGLIERQDRCRLIFVVAFGTDLIFPEVFLRNRGGIPAVSRGGCRHRWRHHTQATDGREDR